MSPQASHIIPDAETLLARCGSITRHVDLCRARRPASHVSLRRAPSWPALVGATYSHRPTPKLRLFTKLAPKTKENRASAKKRGAVARSSSSDGAPCATQPGAAQRAFVPGPRAPREHCRTPRTNSSERPACAEPLATWGSICRSKGSSPLPRGEARSTTYPLSSPWPALRRSGLGRGRWGFSCRRF